MGRDTFDPDRSAHPPPRSQTFTRDASSSSSSSNASSCLRLRSVRPLLPAIRPRCDRREQRLLSIPAGTGRDISRGGCGAAAVHRAVRSLAECGRGDKRVIAPPRSIRADTTPNGETVTSEREGAARLCQPARGGGRALAEGTTPIPAFAVSRLRSNEEERGNRLFFPPRRTISREKSILEAVVALWQ